MLLAAIVAASLVLSGGDEGDGAALTVAQATAVEGIPQDGVFLGAPDAPVALVEYADLQCPYCAQFANDALPELIEDYVRPGRLRIEFRGLAFIGEDSVKALRYALAAGLQDRLWHVTELLFANQGEENAGWVTDDLLDAIGAAVEGLDVERWKRDAESAEVTAQIDRAARQADADGVSGTPTFRVGRRGAALEPLNVASLEASSFRPTLDALLRE